MFPPIYVLKDPEFRYLSKLDIYFPTRNYFVKEKKSFCPSPNSKLEQTVYFNDILHVPYFLLGMLENSQIKCCQISLGLYKLPPANLKVNLPVLWFSHRWQTSYAKLSQFSCLRRRIGDSRVRKHLWPTSSFLACFICFPQASRHFPPTI